MDDLYDAWAFDAPLFYPAADGGPADWLMVAEVPGDLLVAPLAASALRRPPAVPTDRHLSPQPSTR
ncbi:MAG TPA: hypothetical protein VFV32_13505 [Acidimicrobiales bacterium]|nr:hypothetical protein [Acidimicrobiales bacterium]